MVKRKLVHGRGINDADYVVAKNIDGKQTMCPFYRAWKDMLRRCYSDKSKNPTYVGCTVSEEWLTFSNFKAWMERQDWEGKFLDKDILMDGNKEYSKETCIFVDRLINNFFTCCKINNGQLPIGVFEEGRMYKASISFRGKIKHIGNFKTVTEAFDAWVAYKKFYAKELGEMNPNIATNIERKLENLINAERTRLEEVNVY